MQVYRYQCTCRLHSHHRCKLKAARTESWLAGTKAAEYLPTIRCTADALNGVAYRPFGGNKDQVYLIGRDDFLSWHYEIRKKAYGRIFIGRGFYFNS